MPERTSRGLARFARAAAVTVTLLYGGALLLGGMTGLWIRNPAGVPRIWDFLPVYVSGQMALQGNGADAYDPHRLHQAQSLVIGQDFAGLLGWHYPPLFLIVATLLALLPYGAAFLAWVMASATAFAAMLARIAGARAAWAGLALPPSLFCAISGQNGFFTAALFAGFLLCLPTAPLAAGLLAAALSYKPHLGLLMPVALIAGGHGRAFLAAAAGVAAWIGLCILVAPSTLAAFLHFLPQTAHAVLGEGSTGWFKLASIFALARSSGSGAGIAWLLQGGVTLAAALVTALIWRRKIAFAPKAAALAAASMLATPYIYFYDLTLVAIAFAFMWRQRNFDAAEQVLLAAIIACLAGYALAGWPLGFFAALLTLAMTARRAILPPA